MFLGKNNMLILILSFHSITCSRLPLAAGFFVSDNVFDFNEFISFTGIKNCFILNNVNFIVLY